jgi:katanin p60 ATPase-containing subunit A1
MTTIDLCRLHRRLIEAAVAEAQEFEQLGELFDAAQAWECAAQRAEAYADDSDLPQERESRLNTAKSFRDRAARLLGQHPSSTDKEENVTQPASTPFHEIARGMIYRSDVSLEQIAGMESVRREILSAFAISFAAMPDGVVSPRIGNFLFYGFPGTGKTLLAAALSNLLDATFFVVKCGDILSKYYGESSKIVHAIFDEARSHPQSIIFIDELDALAGNRDDMDQSADRRLLVSLLTELDGIQHKGYSANGGNVFTIAATNTPWVLDEAILSRFKRRILIPLPDTVARQQMMNIHFTQRGFQFAGSPETFACLCEGLSGREIEQMTTQAISIMFNRVNSDLHYLAAMKLRNIRQHQLNVQPVTMDDLCQARADIRPVATAKLADKLKSWENQQ